MISEVFLPLFDQNSTYLLHRLAPSFQVLWSLELEIAKSYWEEQRQAPLPLAW